MLAQPHSPLYGEPRSTLEDRDERDEGVGVGGGGSRSSGGVGVGGGDVDEIVGGGGSVGESGERTGGGPLVTSTRERRTSSSNSRAGDALVQDEEDAQSFVEMDTDIEMVRAMMQLHNYVHN